MTAKINDLPDAAVGAFENRSRPIFPDTCLQMRAIPFGCPLYRFILFDFPDLYRFHRFFDASILPHPIFNHPN